MSAIQSDPVVQEVLRYVDRARGTIDTLHLGPLDYNVTTAADYLRTAAGLLEDFGRKHSMANVGGAS